METIGENPGSELGPEALSPQAEKLAAIHQMLAELDELASQLGRDSEILDRICYSRLPEALFHATTKDRAARIAVEGLKPSQLQFEDSEAVSLSDTIGYAKFCASETKGVDPSELVILEVTTQGIDREKFKSYLGVENPKLRGVVIHEVHCTETIDPDWIHQLTDDEVEEIETQESP